MTALYDEKLGPKQQEEVNALIKAIVTPLQQQVADQAKTIEAMDLRIKDLERRLPAWKYSEPAPNEALMSSGGIVASLSKK